MQNDCLKTLDPVRLGLGLGGLFCPAQDMRRWRCALRGERRREGDSAHAAALALDGAGASADA
eukprot:89483-Pleurochrysis_carterae.AAC.1